MGRTQVIGNVQSEFASVELSIDFSGHDARLKVEDLKTGHVGYLDALELETLAWLPEGGLDTVLDPSHHRWREES
jgi:hypothetical protein